MVMDGGDILEVYCLSFKIRTSLKVWDGQKLGSERIFGWEIFRLVIHLDSTIVHSRA